MNGLIRNKKEVNKMVKEEKVEEIPENQKKFEDFPEYKIYEYIPPTSKEVRDLIKKRLDFIEKKMKEYGYDNEEDLFEDERWTIDHEFNLTSDITYIAGVGVMDSSFLDRLVECENDENIKIIEIMIQDEKDQNIFYRGLKSKSKSEDFFKKLHLIFKQISMDNRCFKFDSTPYFDVCDKSGKVPNTNIYRLYIHYYII